MRNFEMTRITNETNIQMKLSLDGQGQADIQTGCGFLDHMLTLFTRHGGFDLTIKCAGDTDVDFHHTTEDVGIVLGTCVLNALDNMKGITRYGDIILPMDESLILSAIDVSGRAYLNFDVDFPTEKIGEFDTELVKEFFEAFVRNSKITLHIKKLYGENSHHIAEGIFKSFARALGKAVKIDDNNKDKIPSTKGTLL